MPFVIDRQTPLADVDPDWAWHAWEPGAGERWDLRRAAHLNRRAGFGLSTEGLKNCLKLSPGEAVESFFTANSQQQDADQVEPSATFKLDSAQLARAVLATGDVMQLPMWWLHRMRYTPLPLVEKMTLFWHSHFATGAEKVLDIELMYQQNQLFRQQATGDFRTLVHGIAKDPAMLIYLDSASNRKAHANENFARELMELFCLGEGHYSEQDVQQLARCFTGWEIRRKQYRFNPYQHDVGAKHVLGSFVETGEEGVDVVLNHPQLPMFIVGKLFRFFVADEPAPSPALLEPLATRFVEDNLRLSGVLRMLLGSRLLLSDWSYGRKIRSPIELVVGLMRGLDMSANLVQISKQLRDIGQALFYPPNVKGWDGGRAWINSATLIGRANLVHQLIHDKNTRFAGGDIAQMFQRAGGSSDRFLRWFNDVFLAIELHHEQQLRVLAGMDSNEARASEQRTARSLLSLLAMQPAFHLA
jgi:uncharacterized protein (DUF1800 family)